MALNYDEQFYAGTHDDVASSAKRLVPIILEVSQAKTVFDFGCGTGTWLHSFKQNGVAEVHGMDGPWVKPGASASVLDASEFTAHDMTSGAQTPRPPRERYDVATSFEVLEHMDEAAVGRAVSLLSGLSDVLVVGVAVPYQGGTDHINEHWPLHWYAKFEAEGYECFDCIRQQTWLADDVCWWYRQNTLVYARGDKVTRAKEYTIKVQGRAGPPLPLVHPAMWLGRVSDLQRKSFPQRLTAKLRSTLRQ